MEKKINFLTTLVTAFCVLITLVTVSCALMTISSCSGGRSVGSGLLGDLPNVVAEMRAEEASYKEEAEGATSMDDLMEISVEAKETEKEYETEIAELSKGLIGAIIPSEVAEGLPYKLASDIKIATIYENGGGFMYPISIITTADITPDLFSPPHVYYNVYLVYVDADGNQLGSPVESMLSIFHAEPLTYKSKQKDYALGTSAECENGRYMIAVRSSTAEDIIKAGTIAKIKFINKEEFDKL